MDAFVTADIDAVMGLREGEESEVAGMEPTAAQPLREGDSEGLPWAEARRRLEDAEFYWLATTRPDGRPHVVPHLALVLDGALYFSAGPGTRKARNLARDPSCVVTTAHDLLHLVVEGNASKVRDHETLQRVADAYAAKYGWEVTVRDGALHGEGAPTAGPPPYEVYQVIPSTVFGFGEDETLSPTRWRFS